MHIIYINVNVLAMLALGVCQYNNTIDLNCWNAWASRLLLSRNTAFSRRHCAKNSLAYSSKYVLYSFLYIFIFLKLRISFKRRKKTKESLEAALDLSEELIFICMPGSLFLG